LGRRKRREGGRGEGGRGGCPGATCSTGSCPWRTGNWSSVSTGSNEQPLWRERTSWRADGNRQEAGVSQAQEKLCWQPQELGAVSAG
ncbi:unnamed protein product, partial [Pleuronectes platessa]